MTPDEKFAYLATLGHNWDSYGAAALDAATIQRAKDWLESACIVPCSSGGVQIEWHRDGVELEVEFMPDGTIELLTAAVIPPRPLVVADRPPHD